MKTLEPPTRKSSGLAAPAADRISPRSRRALPGWQSQAPDLDSPAWELVQRIVASRRFGRSTLLADFLLFVAHRTLSGRAAEINEQQIGIQVFARGESFNPGDDNIVRSYARMLRKRLEEYFRNEGQMEPLVVDMPRGGYVPVFSRRSVPVLEPPLVRSTGTYEAALEAGEPAEERAGVAVPRSGSTPDDPQRLPAADKRSYSRLWLMVCIALVMAAVSGLAGFQIARKSIEAEVQAEPASERLSHLFWQRMFEAKRDTFIVPTDGGLVILRRFLADPVSLTDYVSGRYRNEAALSEGLESLLKTVNVKELPALTHKVLMLGERRYTSIVDLDLSAQFARRREVVAERLLIRYARDLRMDDLRSGNAILIGSVDSNPWVELFQPQLNFQFTYGASYGGSAVIVNLHPLPGEQKSYASITGDPAQRTYGVLAYVPNLDGNGHVLLVEGINMAGTEAAGEFLLNAKKMEPVLKQAMGPSGELRSFEVLLGTASIAANSSRVEVLSERVAKP